ncbi:MAG TPA: amidohydrolase [Bacillota bacterium]
MAILIKNARYLIQDADTVLEGADLVIRGNRIASVSPTGGEPGVGDGAGAGPVEEVIDATEKVVIPGFVNAHTHLYQNLLKNVREDLPLKQWCEEVTFPFADVVHQDHWQRNDISVGYAWSVLGAMEMVRSGITSFIDMDLTLDTIFEAWLDVGVRGIAAITMVNRWVPKDLMRDDSVRKAEVLSYVDRWTGSAGRGLVQVVLAPSTPFACTPDMLAWIRSIADQRDLGVQTHVSETRWEVEQSTRETGTTPLAYLDSLGFLKGHLTAAHCVHLTAAEIDLVQERGVIPIYNPKSNMKLGSGVAPVARMLRQGIPVALATDGAASNDIMDMFEEMRVGALLQKVAAEDPSVISARDMFRMATSNGARAARLDAGELKPGKLADLVILDLNQVHTSPIHDIVQALVLCGKAADVETVLIDGKAVMRDRRFTTISEEETFQRAVAIGADRYERSRQKTLKAEF